MTRARTWLTANTAYEGIPIHFRRPRIEVSEFATLQPRYPRLLIVTHVLKHVKENGLPRSDYNASLESFDMALTSTYRKPMPDMSWRFIWCMCPDVRNEYVCQEQSNDMTEWPV